MINSFPLITFRFRAFLLVVLAIGFTVGCSHDKTKRGHIFRCAFEFNRTPWDGCPPDSGCNDENDCSNESCEKCSTGKKSMFGCFKKGNDNPPCAETKKNKGFRRHCGLNPECTAKNPCCRTLGCGMWLDPSDPNSFATAGSGVKACGLTPFCSPMKPCGLTPNCGRTVNPNLTNQQQMLMLGNNGSVYAGSSAFQTAQANQPIQQPTLPGMQPNMLPGMPAKRTIETQPNPPGGMPGQQGQPLYPTPYPTPNPTPNPVLQNSNQKAPLLAGPNGLLISKGIVPGVSTVTTGGIVAAAGVITPVGMMTPSGVRLPSGVVNPNVVIKACGMTVGCSAAHPCGLVAGCGMMVPINMVSNNAVVLASALQAPGVAGGVLQTGGMMSGFSNPMMSQAVNGPVNGTANDAVMGGIAQTAYRNDPRYAALLAGTAEEDEEEEEEPQAEADDPDLKAKMPLPRFHPVPTKPVFQRSEGLPVFPTVNPGGGVKKTSAKTSAANSKRIFSEESLNDAMEQAYLEGMSAAMEKVEEELDAKAESLTAQKEEQSKTDMQEKILDQAQKLQAKIDQQKELEQQLYQESLRKEAQIQARRTSEQKNKEQQMIEEKAARQLAAKEREIRNEAARQLSELEQVIREDSAKEIAVKEQALQAQLTQQTQLLEAARIQQVRMTQAQMNSGVVLANQAGQQLPVNGMMNSGMGTMNPMSGNKGMFASALDFLKGSDQRHVSQNMPQNTQNTAQTVFPMTNRQPVMSQPMPQYAASQPMMPQTMAPNSGMSASGFSPYQSVKSTGANFLSALSGAVSPLSGLLGSDMPPNMRMSAEPMMNQPMSQPVRNQPTVNPPMPNRFVSVSPSVQPVRQTTGQGGTQKVMQNVSLTSMTPVPQSQKDHVHSQRDCQECKTRPFLADTKPMVQQKRVPFPVLEAEADVSEMILAPQKPRKPPTMAKSKKIIDVDDDDEPTIRQAKFDDR